MDETRSIGVRIREIRSWRGLSLSVVAGLAGISPGYLSRIERGERAIEKRALVESIASSLQVAPSEILAEPATARDPVSKDAHAAIEEISVVLAHNRLGHPFPEQPTMPWPELASELRRFLDVLVPECDYLTQAQMLPGLLEGLYAAHAHDPAHRKEALTGLMMTLHHTGGLLKNLGAHGMPYLVAMHERYVADELDDPAWIGLAEWRMGQSSGGDRARMLAVSTRAADGLQGETDPRCRQVYGMLHLNAALASAILGNGGDAYAHVDEARDTLRATIGKPAFGDLHFTTANWTAWRVAVGLELGEGPAVVEHAKGANVGELPAAERRGMFYGELARGLAQDRANRDRAVAMLRRAEGVAPQRVRTNPYLREVVVELVRQGRRDAMGRELRGIAYRMGVAG